MVESAEPRESKTRKPSAEANAVWLRIRNDSPLPVVVPTHSIFPSTATCGFRYPGGSRIEGLCDGSEIDVWLELLDREGKWLPYGVDFGSSVVLLPGTSVLFPVPHDVLADGRSVAFSFTFQQESRNGEIEDYGNPVERRFGESDLPRE